MMEMMGLVSWIFMGLIAGAAARGLLPGEQRTGLLVTLLLGIAGAIVGGLLSTSLGFGGISGFDIRSLIIAFLGALFVLAAMRALGMRKS